MNDIAAIAKVIGLQNPAPLPEKVGFSDFKQMFKALAHPKADITFFLVKQVVHRDPTGSGHNFTEVDGASDDKLSIAMISNSRNQSTMAHEAGHILMHMEGHLSPDKKLLMQNAGPGEGVGKIPFDHVVDKINTGWK